MHFLQAWQSLTCVVLHSYFWKETREHNGSAGARSIHDPSPGLLNYSAKHPRDSIPRVLPTVLSRTDPVSNLLCIVILALVF